MTRIGIFGGTFNPIHSGHINSISSVKEVYRLDKVYVVPAFQAPNRKPTHGPLPEERLAMVKEGVASLDFVEVSDIEVARGGVSYTYDTVTDLKRKHEGDELFLIIGMDQFEVFDHWHLYEEILKKVDLIVTSRPGLKFPPEIDDLPPGILALTEDLGENKIQLKSGKQIHFCQLEDIDVSASDIRKQLRSGAESPLGLPERVKKFVRERGLYTGVSGKIGSFEAFTQECAGILHARNAIRVLGFDLSELEQPTEFVLVASGTSTRHSAALADHLIRAVKTKYGVYPLNTEGAKEGRWIVLDYGSLMIHIFYDFVRLEYRLEELWSEGKPLTFDFSLKESGT